jgi:2-amino-4-hydroxy-6-hydroxymethyldihydropteridine diphosphokinase
MILLALGSNLASRAGLPAQTLDAALESLSRHGVRIAATSLYYVTPSWPDPNEPPYVNAVVRVETELSPSKLLELLHSIERDFGRVRAAANAPRTLDLDLLAYGTRVEEGPPVLPHPRLAERSFVLVPLADVAPDWRHPKTGMTVQEMLTARPEEERRQVRPLARGGDMDGARDERGC